MNADMSDSVIYRTKNYVDNWDEMKSYRLFALETGWPWEKEYSSSFV